MPTVSINANSKLLRCMIAAPPTQICIRGDHDSPPCFSISKQDDRKTDDSNMKRAPVAMNPPEHVICLAVPFRRNSLISFCLPHILLLLSKLFEVYILCRNVQINNIYVRCVSPALHKHTDHNYTSTETRRSARPEHHERRPGSPSAISHLGHRWI